MIKKMKKWREMMLMPGGAQNLKKMLVGRTMMMTQVGKLEDPVLESLM